ncbi:F-box domain-containing protein [Mycena venus]|uniref:F-box domain-containing protein n=1 Tax=Mycena venus TaxID=2733690 RepID=A0A8H6XBA7_9AGAR|nr:F-box domain-containing protein [Mycena venus]
MNSDSAQDFINRLPPEIIMDIFSKCCSERYSLQDSMAIHLSGAVCSRWRTLALSMPELWASFSIKIAGLASAGFGAANSSRNDIIALSRLLHLHLERSANCPLSFDVSFDKSDMSPALSDLLAVLLEHSERWSSVKLPYSHAFASIYARLRGRLGRLETLELTLNGVLDSTDNCFEDTPQLRRLALGTSLPRKMPLPRNQLTVLHLGAAPTMEFFQFMTLGPCPHLTTLILNPYYPLKLPTIPQTLPALIRLHTLILAIRDGFSPNPIIDCLDILTAPSLEHLDILGRREIQLPPQTFESFLERSGCTLRTLTITFKDNLPFHTLQRNLRALSSLTHFTIFTSGKEGGVVDRILHSLTQSDVTVGCLLPNLISFELQAAKFHPAVVNLAASRLVSGPKCARLEKLILHDIPHTQAACERLKSFREQGMLVSYLPRCKPCRNALFI